MMIRLLCMSLFMVILAGCSMAPVDSHIEGYLTTPQGGLLKNPEGQCWRTAGWRPWLAIAECDPELVRERRESGLPVAELEEDVIEQQAEPDRTVWPSEEAEELPAPPSQRVLDALPTPGLLPTLTLTEDRPLALSGDASFHFGHHRLTPRGRESLAYLASAIRRQQARELTVEITGHTDRIGSREANMVLSRQRADTVREALIEMGIEADAITAVGKGMSEPLTTLEDCPADLVHCELIACLAEDRRVEVKVSGIREVRR
ncbi:MAG: hypothetical protein CVV10_02205 [Gammaproteobacteria bacterium HGW-Gammaproteobacteria-14]|nr:MAG: hypothetical protein CVV10_02205 [Gammaproteobacteria bacterium HGW-Gammaproteobacteria-14]